MCSLVNAFSGVFSDGDHTAYIAEHWTELVGAMIDGVLDYRERNGDDAFHDMDYRELIDDPVGAVARLYDRFGIELSAEAEQGMGAWATEHRQGEHGRHTYSLGEFDLDRAALDERFARYFMRHDVEREAV